MKNKRISFIGLSTRKSICKRQFQDNPFHATQLCTEHVCARARYRASTSDERDRAIGVGSRGPLIQPPAAWPRKTRRFRHRYARRGTSSIGRVFILANIARSPSE